MHRVRIVVTVSLLLGTPLASLGQGNRPSAGGPLGDVQEQVDDNTLAIEILEEKTTLSDLPCSTDEIAKFDGTDWICAPNPEAVIADLTNALCAKAERDGDTVRPLVCDARCDCFQTQLAQGVVTSCSETAPGDFSAELVETRREQCVGGGLFGLYCENSTQDSCSCQTCTSFGIPFPCNCTGCSDGESCRTLFSSTSGTCFRPCSTGDDCPIADFDVTLALNNVGTSGSPEVAQCSCGDSACPSLEINSRDAAACLTQIEDSLGGSCTIP